jgi:hypothetical protein
VSRIVFLDTETTSLIPGPATIWELAVILRDLNAHEEGDTEFLWHMRPDLTGADPRSLEVGGYYERCMARGFPPGTAFRLLSPPDDTGEQTSPRRLVTADLAAEVAPMLSGTHLIAANPAFDAAHMEALLRANGECPAWDYHLTDIGSLVRGWAARGSRLLPFPLKVADAARVAGIDPDQYEAHSALGDARLVRDIYDAVTGGGAS